MFFSVVAIVAGAYLTFGFTLPKEKVRQELAARIFGALLLVGGVAGFAFLI